MSWDFAIDPLIHTVLGSVRVLAMLQTAPLFREQGIPGRIKAALALAISFMVSPAGTQSVDWESWSALDLGIVILIETGIGLMIGLSSYFVFIGLWMLGEFISTQGGLSAARVVDPSSGVSSTALAQAFNGFGVLVFVAIEGHHELVRLLAHTFSELPIGLASPDLNGYMALVHSGSVMFEIAAQLAAPITVAIFIQNVATGVLSKSLQQLNLMVVQLPAHIGIVLLIIGFGAEDFVHAIKDILEASPERVAAIVIGAG